MFFFVTNFVLCCCIILHHTHTHTKKLATSHPTGLGYGCYSNSSDSPFDVGAASGAKNEYQSGIWVEGLCVSEHCYIGVMLRQQLKRISRPLLLSVSSTYHSFVPLSLFVYVPVFTCCA